MVFTARELARILVHLGDEPLEGLQVIAAEALATQRYPHFDPGQPVLVLGPARANLVEGIRRTLLEAYPEVHPVTLIAAAGRRPSTLAAWAAPPPLGPDMALLIPARSTPASYAVLQDVVARLRAPDGCPWDRALTWEKLRASLLEETFELLAALDASDAGKVAEEQGDLLLQVAMQVQIAAEAGRFRLPDVIAAIVDKLIRRHPHVFGDAVVSGTDEVLANWEAIKAAERASNGAQRSPLAGVPGGLPALAQAEA